MKIKNIICVWIFPTIIILIPQNKEIIYCCTYLKNMIFISYTFNSYAIFISYNFTKQPHNIFLKFVQNKSYT